MKTGPKGLSERLAFWRALQANEPLSPLSAEYEQRADDCEEALKSRETIASLRAENERLRSALKDILPRLAAVPSEEAIGIRYIADRALCGEASQS